MRVAVVKADSTLRLAPITIERDLGSSLQISSGLAASDRIVQIANAELHDGQKVEAVAPKAPASAAPAPSATSDKK